jgi:hypothetical protein
MAQALATRTIVTHGDLGANTASFARHPRASNLAPRTVKTYLESLDRFAEFLTEAGLRTGIAAMSREQAAELVLPQHRRRLGGPGLRGSPGHGLPAPRFEPGVSR